MAGKFLPPHPGHSLVIEAALAECESVDVVVCDRPGEWPPASERARWLEALHPRVTVHVVDDICAWHGDEPCPPRCSPAWAEHLRGLGLGPWTHVHGSEGYVTGFAAALGAAPRPVDPERRRVPLSGSAVRANLDRHWHELAPVVRAGLIRRVVVLGAESSGTTTLAQDLGERLGAAVVPEYGREFSARRAVECGSIWDVTWSPEDFTHIAAEQERLEKTTLERWANVPDGCGATDRGGPFLMCDTDTLATAVWHRRYLGDRAPALLKRSRARPPLLYVLTSPRGVAFHQDGLRDGEAIREAMTEWFREALAGQRAPWIEVGGGRERRVEDVCDWLAAHAGAAVRTAPSHRLGPGGTTHRGPR